jgi:hypothetical protein
MAREIPTCEYRIYKGIGGITIGWEGGFKGGSFIIPLMEKD